MDPRITRIQGELRRERLDAVVLTNPHDVLYATGYASIMERWSLQEPIAAAIVVQGGPTILCLPEANIALLPVIAERGRPWDLIREFPRETAIVFTLTAGGALGFYTYAIYMQKLLVNTAGFTKPVAAEIMTWVSATLLFLPPLIGWISDSVGRKPTLVAAFGASALLAVPVLGALGRATDPLEVYLLCLLPLFCLSGYYALSAIIKAELYPTRLRATAAGWAGAVSRLGGVGAPLMIGVLLQSSGGDRRLPMVIIAGLLLVAALLVAISGEETRGRTLEELSG